MNNLAVAVVKELPLEKIKAFLEDKWLFTEFYGERELTVKLLDAWVNPMFGVSSPAFLEVKRSVFLARRFAEIYVEGTVIVFNCRKWAHKKHRVLFAGLLNLLMQYAETGGYGLKYNLI